MEKICNATFTALSTQWIFLLFRMQIQLLLKVTLDLLNLECAQTIFGLQLGNFLFLL